MRTCARILFFICLLSLLGTAGSRTARAESLSSAHLSEHGMHVGECACPLCTAPALSGGDDHQDALETPSPNLNPAIQAFTISSSKWPQANLGDPVTITYSYNNFLDGGLRDANGVSLPADFIRASVETALSLWAAVAPLDFVEVEDQGGPVPTTNYANGQFGQIRFHHRYINGPDIPGQTPKAKAQAYYPNAFSNIAGDVFFDNGDPWQESGELTIPDILGAATHEIGHSLGIGHSAETEANMYWIFRRTSGLDDAWLHPDDIAAVRAIYGTGTGSVTPLFAHLPEPTALSLLLVGMGISCVAFPRRPLRRSKE